MVVLKPYTRDLSALAPCVFSYSRWKLSKQPYIPLNLLLFKLDIIYSSEKAVKLRRTDPGWKASRVPSIFWCRPSRNASQANNTPQREFASYIWVWGVNGARVDRLISLFLRSDSQLRCPHFPLSHCFLPWSPAIFVPPPSGDKLFPSPSAVTFTLRLSISINTRRHVRSQLLIANTAKHHRITSRLLSETHVLPGLVFHPRADI